MISKEIKRVYDSFFNHISQKFDYLIPFINRRMSNEKWIQGEFIYDLYQLKKNSVIIDYVPEKPYLIPKSGFCDIWFKTINFEIWVELKAIVTNYGSPGINITDRVNQVISDTKKLKEKSTNGFLHVMFIVYPLKNDSSTEKTWNNKHMSRIIPHIELIMDPYELQVDNQYFCRFYIGEVH